MKPRSSASYSMSLYDDRSGLGYGQTVDRFHKSRMSGAEYPYSVDNYDSDDEDFIEDETLLALNKKLPHYYPNDPGASRSTDPFYFAAGNTKLSDCFFRTNRVLLEVEAFGDSMHSVPAAYSGPRVSGGSSPYLTTGNFRRTGTKKGFSSSPPPLDTEEDLENDSEFYSLFGLSKILRKSLGE